jgi:hypothetical protein
MLRRVGFPGADRERCIGAVGQHCVRLLCPVLDVMRMRVAQLGLTFGVEARIVNATVRAVSGFE